MTEQTVSDRNPFIELDENGKPIYQLKLSLVFYLDYPPGPKRARQIYDQYFARFGRHIRYFQSTSWLGPPQEWNSSTQVQFERQNIEDLQHHDDWGYGFSDGRSVDNNLFMFHGYKPVSEAGKASFFRFEWPWNWDTNEIVAFARSVADSVPFLSGTGGYIINPHPFDNYAYARMYALCRRYWGLEAWDLDLTVNFVASGYKCPNWLTLIGNNLCEQHPERAAGLDAIRGYADPRSHGVIFQSRIRPEFIDRNRAHSYDGEAAIATALLPLQISYHEDFGGPAWEGKTMDWLYRFSGRQTVDH